MAVSGKKKKKADPRGLELFKKILKDKRTISEHLRNGGNFEELNKKGFRFATI